MSTPTKAADCIAELDLPIRETRIAVVLNGGVSLAIWIGGVTNEVDRLRRAGYDALRTSGSDPLAPAKGSGSTERWEELLGLLGIRVVVDVIAGASAGGLNGAVLATAIANGVAMPALRDTWLDIAAIQGDLLRSDTPQRISVLNGNFFLEAVDKVFEQFTPATDPPDPPVTLAAVGGVSDAVFAEASGLAAALDQERTLPRAVSLTTTATAMHGEGVDFIDSNGNHFSHLENRCRCSFRRDVDGNGALSTSSVLPQLARAARASASFPAAFDPTYFNATNNSTIPGVIGEGPNMTGPARITTSRWMIDGGVLDNEPFGPLLDDVVRQPIDQDVERIVAYIVPSAGEVHTTEDTFTERPGLVASVMAAMSLPREVDILNDLARLRDMKEQGDTSRETSNQLLTQAQQGLAGAEPTGVAAAARTLFEQYRGRRLETSAWEARSIALEKPDGTTPFTDPPEPDADGVTGTEWQWIPPSDALASTGYPISPWRWGLRPAQRLIRQQLQLVRDAAISDPDSAAYAAPLLVLSTALRRVTELSATFAESIGDRVPREHAMAFSDRQIHGMLQELYTDATQDGTSLEAALAELVQSGAAATVAALPEPSQGDADPVQAANRLVLAQLHVEVLQYAFASVTPQRQTPRFRFHRFGITPTTPFLQVDMDTNSKVTGLRLGHFGAFIKRSWRAYDWLWGRLDGASHLVDALVQDRSLRRIYGADVDQATYESRRLCLESFAPGAGGILDEMRAHWTANDDGTNARIAPEKLESHLSDIRRELVIPLHREILAEEIPAVTAAHWPSADRPMEVTAAITSNDADDATLAAAFTTIYNDVPANTVSALAASPEGVNVVERLAAAALRALSVDPALAGAGPARHALGRLADVIDPAPSPGGIVRTVGRRISHGIARRVLGRLA